MDGASSSQENFHNPGEILAPLQTFPSGRKLPASGTHELLEASPPQVQPVVKLAYGDTSCVIGALEMTQE